MKDLNKLIDDIESIKIQGAKQIAVESLKFLKDFCKKKGFGKEFTKTADRIEKSRQTAVVLHNCLDILREKKSIKTIDILLRQLKNSSIRIARNGSSLIKENSVILTHCHSGEALSVIKAAKDKNIRVIATITEPVEQGLITAKELAELKIPVTLIVDSAVSFFMSDVDMIILGCDGLREDGNVNKIGSFNIALSAWVHKKPYYVVADTLKLDRREKFFIEERPSKEVHEKMKDVVIRNPAFDITPWRYITRVVTEKGVMTPGNVLKLLR